MQSKGVKKMKVRYFTATHLPHNQNSSIYCESNKTLSNLRFGKSFDKINKNVSLSVAKLINSYKLGAVFLKNNIKVC